MFDSLMGMMAEINEAQGKEGGGGFKFKSGNEFTVIDPILEFGGGLTTADARMNQTYFHKYGKFKWMEFESKEEMFGYVSGTEDYGWNDPQEALCFAFQVHENDDQSKYELELFFRD